MWRMLLCDNTHENICRCVIQCLNQRLGYKCLVCTNKQMRGIHDFLLYLTTVEEEGKTGEVVVKHPIKYTFSFSNSSVWRLTQWSVCNSFALTISSIQNLTGLSLFGPWAKEEPDFIDTLCTPASINHPKTCTLCLLAN